MESTQRNAQATAQATAEAIELATELALNFHRGQRDADGDPYILHLMRVMLKCHCASAKQAGLLHDILEDTSATEEDLIQAGICPNVTQSVKRLTRTAHIDYADYILALADDPIAKEVKIADLEDNYAIGRVKYRFEHRLEDAHRLERYILSHRFLSGHLQRTEYIEAMRLVGSA
jgi:(p)ppGpp synthase/HD superfamily hydrolase